MLKGDNLNGCRPLTFVGPWGVEPQSKEPESFILSIELRVQKCGIPLKLGAKLVHFL